MSPAEAVEAVARASYGQLLAWLAWRWRDIAAAEDALAEAFATALERWPRDGLPASPQAWLLTVAKRNLLMAARRQRLEDDPTLTVLWPGAGDVAPAPSVVPDTRLRLLFVCAHPDIDQSVHSALMLQTVLGLDAGQIASAFLVKPETMTKRLVRAKARTRDLGIRFEVPEPREWPERLGSVLEAIYGAYTLHWGMADATVSGQLAEEAVFLAELVASLLPQEPEALGLAALLRFGMARRAARINDVGAFVPLDAQDTAQWDAAQWASADATLRKAAQYQRPGPYQIEAAIESAHMHGVWSGDVPWVAIVLLYESLLHIAPTVGSRIAHAVAVAHASADPASGLALLNTIDPALIAAHQPWWAAAGHLYAKSGYHREACHAYGRALALTTDPWVRCWMEEQYMKEKRANDHTP